MMNEENDERSLLLYGIAMTTIVHVIRLVLFALLAKKSLPTSYLVIEVVILYTLSIASLFFIPILLNLLAPSFGGRKDSLNTLKLYLFLVTPMWVGETITPIPIIGWIGIAGLLFGFYLAWEHLTEALYISENKKSLYFVNIIFLMISVSWVKYAVASRIAYWVAPFPYHAHGS